MRISPYEKKVIIDAVKIRDKSAVIWLFGSRANDSKKGGDIDIAVLSNCINRREKNKIIFEIEQKIGEQKIDLSVFVDDNEPFFSLAKETGVKISG